jgi:RimJ/RimL family protein N-acetyltransferase
MLPPDPFKGIHVTEMMAADVPFLLDLWGREEVMRYADEFPHPRGWTRRDDVETAWAEYRRRRKFMGNDYAQLILRLGNRQPVGESFRFPLDNRFTFGKWSKPMELRANMMDIKLHPGHWGMGLGSAFMGMVVENAFTRTRSQLLVVPPHKKNPVAVRVYEKTGFLRAKPLSVHRGHYIMELPRDRFEELYRR